MDWPLSSSTLYKVRFFFPGIFIFEYLASVKLYYDKLSYGRNFSKTIKTTERQGMVTYSFQLSLLLLLSPDYKINSRWSLQTFPFLVNTHDWSLEHHFYSKKGSVLLRFSNISVFFPGQRIRRDPSVGIRRNLSVGLDRPLLLISSFNKLVPRANFRGR